ncbi:MAG: 4-hydroxythreonine-4-phosphate dehydrogenase PdxA, partial [Pseudomonadota bacterium]
AAGFAHPGHTEFLAELADDGWSGTTPHTAVMMLAADDLRVVPVTIHIPLKNVAQALTAPLLRATLRTVIAALRSDYGIATPRIICTGLNPHAGENGEIGREDIDLIAPVVQEFAQAGAHISGPVSADTCFHAEARANADVIVAMYHDQALIPIKTLAFDRGVNVTLGLPFIRTSPDHGTAFAIAGTGKANPHSLIEALKHAAARAEIRRDRTAALENAV